VYPRISKFFFEILVCFSSHSRPRSFKLIQVDVVERGVSRWTLDQKWSALTALTSQVWHLQLSVIFIAVCSISGRRRERFLSETSRASNPNSSSRVLVDFLEVSQFHKGNSDFFRKFHVLSLTHFRGLYVISPFQMINGASMV